MNGALKHFEHQCWALAPGKKRWQRLTTYETDEVSIDSFASVYDGRKIPIEGATVIIISTEKQPTASNASPTSN